HELGHNLGAPHDGEAGSACAATPTAFLMAPTVNGSGTFSDCSLTQLSAFIATKRGSCIVSANYADIGVGLTSGTTTSDDGGPCAFPVGIHAVGNAAAAQVAFTATLPAGIALQSATVSGGSCSPSGATDVICTIGAMTAGEDRAATLMLVGAQPGGGSVT